MEAAAVDVGEVAVGFAWDAPGVAVVLSTCAGSAAKESELRAAAAVTWSDAVLAVEPEVAEGSWAVLRPFAAVRPRKAASDGRVAVDVVEGRRIEGAAAVARARACWAAYCEGSGGCTWPAAA